MYLCIICRSEFRCRRLTPRTEGRLTHVENIRCILVLLAQRESEIRDRPTMCWFGWWVSLLSAGC